MDKTTVDTLSGFPKVGNTSLVAGGKRRLTHTLSKLEPGLRFHVKVELGARETFSEWTSEMGGSDGDVSTACGCSSVDLTGGPKGVSATQVISGLQG